LVGKGIARRENGALLHPYMHWFLKWSRSLEKIHGILKHQWKSPYSQNKMHQIVLVPACCPQTRCFFSVNPHNFLLSVPETVGIFFKNV